MFYVGLSVTRVDTDNELCERVLGECGIRSRLVQDAQNTVLFTDTNSVFNAVL